MNKILSIMLLLLLLPETAAAQLNYVRKKVAPDFFIPNRELTHKEKLPPFPVLEEKLPPAPQETVNPKTIETPRIERVFSEEEIEDTIPPETQDGDIVLSDLENAPLYRQRMEQYEKDLAIISQTGKMPENSDLQKDLQKMVSDEPQPF